MTNLILGASCYRKISKKQPVFPPLNFPRITKLSWLLLGGILVIIILVGLIGIIAPPNNWDSMTYHMSRVMHWIQNQNLAHYPTYYSAQLVHPPLAEIGIMHLQILSGSDRFANLIQWFAMVSSIIGVSLIAKQLGAKQEGQLLASVFCATLPMGILQGSSTQNDYVVALFIVCLAYYTLALVSHKVIYWSVIFAIGASFGLALLTKSSAYFLSFPFLVWSSLWLWKKKKWKFHQYLLVIFLIGLLFNIAHYSRNFEVFNSPISAADYREENQNEIYSLPTLISTVIRQLSFHSDIIRYLHLEGFLTPITGKVEKLIYLIHQHILNLDPSDPRITMPGYTFRVPGVSFNEDVAVNPLHLMLIFFAIFAFIFNKKLRVNKISLTYLVVLMSSFLLFSLLLKVQPYSVRHHLPFFILFSPVVGLCYSQIIKPIPLKILAFILIVTCLPWLFNNNLRSLVGEKSILTMPRNDIYFIARQQIKEPYNEIAQIINQQECSNIGLSLGWDTKYTGKIWEYPLWVLITQGNSQKDYHFSHVVSPDNYSAKLMNQAPHNQFNYCALIAIRSSKDEPIKEMKLENQLFIENWSNSSVKLLLPKN
ncbi:ArnT family glycosyltransferase [Crocosphaera chwakensis]|nr:glycosyltransferase family 39 protein [Crocosphaera chwakensis]